MSLIIGVTLTIALLFFCGFAIFIIVKSATVGDIGGIITFSIILAILIGLIIYAMHFAISREREESDEIENQ